jgi:hypothetical protein
MVDPRLIRGTPSSSTFVDSNHAQAPTTDGDINITEALQCQLTGWLFNVAKFWIGSIADSQRRGAGDRYQHSADDRLP